LGNVYTSSSMWEVIFNYRENFAFPKNLISRTQYAQYSQWLRLVERVRGNFGAIWTRWNRRVRIYTYLSEYQCVHLKIHLDRPGFEARANALKGHCLLFHDKKSCMKRSQCYVIIALPVLLGH